MKEKLKNVEIFNFTLYFNYHLFFFKIANDYVQLAECSVSYFEQYKCVNEEVYKKFKTNKNSVNIWFHRYKNTYNELDKED